jgi:hypothetical protein
MFLKNYFRKDVNMALLLVLTVLVLLFASLYLFEVGDHAFTMIGIVISSLVLGFALILLVCIRNDIRSEIVSFNEVKASVERARAELRQDVVERAALTNTVIKWNIWLAKKQYRNKGIWDIYIPDEVDSLKKLL